MTERVAVCIATYRRPEGLTRLLDSLAHLEPVPDAEVAVVVVDNDPDHGAAPVLAAADLPYRLVVGHEPRPGYAAVRNASVALAGDADLLAFVDDDEVVDPPWLAALVAAARAYRADAVVGQMVHEADDPPAWFRAAGLLDPVVVRTGARLDVVNTGNLLVRRTVLDGLDPVFDPDLGLTGGEDTDLGLRLCRRGAVVVGAADAVARERLSPDRLTLGWQLRKAFRSGAGWSLLLDRYGEAGVARVVAAIARLLCGVGLAGLGALTLCRHRLARGVVQAALGAGGLCGLAGCTLVPRVGADGTRSWRLRRVALPAA